MGTVAKIVEQSSTGQETKKRDLSIDYLRTSLTLAVIAHHCTLAYTKFAVFNPLHVLRSTAPVVDSSRWIFFDYAENFNDVYFMSLMFFVSGLFVFPALMRHGLPSFLRDRIFRLGVPFIIAVCGFMPIAFYASWQLGPGNHGFVDFYSKIAKSGFLVGPPWFIWVLLLFDVVLATLFAPVLTWFQGSRTFWESLRNHPVLTFAAMLFLSGLVYLPMLARYGFDTWAVILTPPFAFQQARIGLYALWFTFGVLVGIAKLSNGLLSKDGGLARSWKTWVATCIVIYNALYFVPRLLPKHGMNVHSAQVIEAFLWVFSCAASCFGLLALFRGLQFRPRPWMDSLSRSAYVMYLVHYVFVLWSQRLMLHLPMHAGWKFLAVFTISLSCSWLTAQVFIRIPGLKRIV